MSKSKSLNSDHFLANKPQGTAEQQPRKRNYLDIWDSNPSFTDINTIYASIKGLSVIIIAVFFIVALYLTGSHLLIGLLVGIITVILFVIVFSDTIFGLRMGVSSLFNKNRKVNLFTDFTFFFADAAANVLYITNKEQLKTVALSIFKVGALPETTKATLNQYIKVLNKHAMPYTFQIHQQPLISSNSSGNFKEYLSQEHNGTMKSFQTAIYFATYYDISGILTSRKFTILQELFERFLDSMRADFVGDFHHYHMQLLSRNQLIHALRSFVIRDIPYSVPKQMEVLKPSISISSYIMKVAFCIFVLITISTFLWLLNITFWIIALLDLCLLFLIFWVWWREPLYYLSAYHLLKREGVSILNPFQGIQVFQHKGILDALFFLIHNKLLVCEKMVNIHHAAVRFRYNEDMVRIVDFYPNKFYLELIERKIPFVYTAMASPLSFYRFDKIAYHKLNTHTQDMLKFYLTSNEEGERWLKIRSGVWQVILTASTYAYKSFEEIDFITEHDYISLASIAQKNITFLEDRLTARLDEFYTTPLSSQKLISGCLCEILKNKLYNLSGTYLQYLLLQGKVLMRLTGIEDEFKKGIITKLAAEFNTPLNLENFIAFGHTINTEFWQKEIPAGLTRDQIDNVLLVNGTAQERDLLAMKIVIQLIKQGVPSLIFDYSGQWSRLIPFFKDANYKFDIVHFKMGNAFSIDPLSSDLLYGKNNTDYLEYIYDAYRLTFKKDRSSVDRLKKFIQEHSDLTLASLALELKNQVSWKKYPHVEELISMFEDFTEDEVIFFHSNLEGEKQTITFKSFISDNKTVIIDLSNSNDLKKKNFLTLVIVSKIIHYISKYDEFCEKVLFLPHLDLVFDERSLDKYLDLGSIDKFFEPLRREGFGTVIMANQMHYMHPHFLKLFKNIMTFRATDYRDINVLKNIMGLQELHGTGYYSKSRKDTYQVEYLKNMKSTEILVKRDDVNQTFPVKFEVADILRVLPLSMDEIAAFMREQGYDLQLTERRIIERTRKTIFEKDFGKFSQFIPEIITFLDGLKVVHKLPISERKIKDALKKVIHEKAKMTTDDRRELKKLKQELYNILITQRYLVEAHPKSASGQETMRTSYQVGEHYEIALDDYFQTKKEQTTDISVEVIEQNSEQPFQNKNRTKDITSIRIFENDLVHKILVKELKTFYYEIFQIYKHITEKDLRAALKIEKVCIKSLFMRVYHQINSGPKKGITQNDFNLFYNLLISYQKLPFSQKQLYYYLNYCDNVQEHDLDLEAKVVSAYELYSDFYHKLKKHLEINATKTCEYCGVKIESDSLYCPGCGVKIKSSLTLE